MALLLPAELLTTGSGRREGTETAGRRAEHRQAAVRLHRAAVPASEPGEGRERLAELDTADEAAGDMPSTDDVALLGQLPYLVLNLERAPQELLRPLFEILDLRIQLHLDSDAVTLTITLPARMTTDLVEAAGRIEEVVPPAARQSCGSGTDARAVAGGAPNGMPPASARTWTFG